jgi:hypothetical protein
LQQPAKSLRIVRDHQTDSAKGSALLNERGTTMAVQLTSDAELDELYGNLFEQLKTVSQLSVAVSEGGTPVDVSKQLLLLLSLQSQLMLGIYTELAAARLDRRMPMNGKPEGQASE